jgi:hypothetical protein
MALVGKRMFTAPRSLEALIALNLRPVIRSSVGHTHSWLAASDKYAALWSDDGPCCGDLQSTMAILAFSSVSLIR